MYRQRDALQTRVEEAQEHVARLGVAVEMFEEELKDVEALAERRKGLTFAAFQHLNRQRCDEAFTHGVEDWPIQNWALAIAGEAGELCNLIKKIIRGDFTVEEKRDEIIEELADVITYCDLAMSRMGVATDDSLLRKFDKVSERRGWSSPARAAIEEGT
jgi:NTP pyrophosphatase (non-canonical NTP hydrolase)